MSHQFTVTPARVIEILSIAGMPSNGTPATLVCWAYADSLPAVAGLINIQSTATADAHHLKTKSASSSLWAETIDQGVFSQEIQHLTPISLATWFHAVGIFSDVSTRSVILNATNQVNGGSVVNASGMDKMMISWGPSGDRWEGKLAALGYWEAVLLAGEIASLAKGFPPRRIRPQSLKLYIPGIRECFNWSKVGPVYFGGVGDPNKPTHSTVQHRSYGF